jgi:hypothetical protein
MNRHLLVVAAALLAAACTRDVKPAAKADPPYVFPHSPHVDGDVDCLLCHASIAKATALEARVRHVALPKGGAACAACHEAPPTVTVPARTREFEVRVDHAAHLARGVKCVTCHVKLTEAKETEPAPLSMSTCTACHQHQKDFAEARCTPCHVDLKRYEKPVAAFQHAGDFMKIHGQLARPTAETCAQCHEQTFCADCHSATTSPVRQAIAFPEAVQRDFIHRGDYVSRHMVEADANPASCRKCHGSQFCNACHTLQNLSQSSGVQPRNPHPPGWGTDVAGGNFHGNAARKNIVACAGCHDAGAAAICVQCHRVGGFADNPANPNGPHPASFISKHRSDDRTKQAVCMTCHPN